jgi:hypothetical protein
MLMAMVGSALTAAFTNYGEAVRKRDVSQLDLFVNSMELTLRATLEDGNDDGALLAEVSTLTGRILSAAIAEVDRRELTPNHPEGERIASGVYPDISFSIDLADPSLDGWNVSYNTTIVGEMKISRIRDEQSYFINGGEVHITVITRYKETFNVQPLVVTSVTTYHYNGGEITGDVIEDIGAWTFHRHEKA